MFYFRVASLLVVICHAPSQCHAQIPKSVFEATIASYNANFSIKSAEIDVIHFDFTNALTVYSGVPVVLTALQDLNPQLSDLLNMRTSIPTVLAALSTQIAPLSDPIDPIVSASLDSQISVAGVSISMLTPATELLRFQFDAALLAVPEPTTIATAGIGMVVLVGMRMRRRIS